MTSFSLQRPFINETPLLHPQAIPFSPFLQTPSTLQAWSQANAASYPMLMTQIWTRRTIWTKTISFTDQTLAMTRELSGHGEVSSTSAFSSASLLPSSPSSSATPYSTLYAITPATSPSTAISELMRLVRHLSCE